MARFLILARAKQSDSATAFHKTGCADSPSSGVLPTFVSAVTEKSLFHQHLPLK
jgi:hypothetical protein